MFDLFKFKEKKFIREAFRFFYAFGERAGLDESQITRLLPRTDATSTAVRRAYMQKLKPIDAAMILADCCVAEAEQKIQFVKNKAQGFQHGIEKEDNPASMLFGFDMMEAWAEGDKKSAEEIQMVAFEMGPKLGSRVALQIGRFSEMAKKYSHPVE